MEIIKQNISWTEIENIVEKIAITIKQDLPHLKTIYGAPRGGLIPAVILSHKTGLTLIFDKKEINSSTLVIDDINDTGETLFILKPIWSAVLYRRVGSKYNSDINGVWIENDNWLVFPWEEKDSEAIQDYKKE